jgi:two-component system NarL family sensor kinase
MILYSDERRLIGQTFPIDGGRAKAFAGEIAAFTPDVSEAENLYERGLGPLYEYYVPMYGPNGDVIAVFGVYEDAARLNDTLASSRRVVWFGIGIGTAVFLAFMATLTVTNARIITRRVREAERLADELGRTREDERRRIVGALHDDIGQPLYRVLYGVRGVRARTGDDEPLSEELETLEELIEAIDAALRSELSLLHRESFQQVDVEALLSDLASDVEADTGLIVDLDIAVNGRLPGVMRSALVRAAREAVTNVQKHADATHVSITLREGVDRVVLDVRDDGVGVDSAPGLGLTISRQRLEGVGGGMEISQEVGRGTLFRAWVPLQLQPEEE